jgi:hypothetical protein
MWLDSELDLKIDAFTFAGGEKRSWKSCESIKQNATQD